MAKQIDHDKLNEFFPIAADFEDLVGRYKDKKLELEEEQNAKNKQKLERELRKIKEQLSESAGHIKKLLKNVQDFKTADGGVINKTTENLERVTTELKQAA